MPTKVRRFRVIDGKTGDTYTVVDMRRSDAVESETETVAVEPKKPKQKPK